MDRTKDGQNKGLQEVAMDRTTDGQNKGLQETAMDRTKDGNGKKDGTQRDYVQ